MAEDINQLLKVRREKLQNLQEAGKDPFKITKCDVTHHSMEIKNNYDELEGKTVTIAGRMMFKRVMGKASFCNTRDLEGDIQAYVARDNIGEDSYKDFKKYDVGDLLCITGEVFKTKTGEISSYHNKGMHTTTFSEMFPVDGNGYIIDTPGVKGFGTFDMEEEEIGHYFPEIFKISADCKYNNCTHRHEPGCAVRKAVEEHLISESRYTSYLNMLEDKEEGKYRAAY